MRIESPKRLKVNSRRAIATATAVKTKLDQERYIPVRLPVGKEVAVDTYARGSNNKKWKYVGTYILKTVNEKTVSKYMRGRKRSKKYKYNYVRMILPWYSTLRAKGVRGKKIEIKYLVRKPVYRKGPRGGTYRL